MNSYAKIEQRLFDDFIRFGYSREVAEAIAHSFTKYVLGYFDDDQVFECLMKSGATEDVVEAVIESFRQAKKVAPIAPAGSRKSVPSGGLGAR